ncbi:hypothetical protein L226DRAFT_257802 [Lentinus tigrinus ALCF2SS1-7]|uniref:uncharacterized protein n=1 Tax=Lentinus tigrinus ALCF2SS1-7 TaxID=1328758 RepID=UPI00116608E6|nr:hypothetical protein L226DRAFT_257802 [Lentinus tigrinus ALCF2SS1-7]
MRPDRAVANSIANCCEFSSSAVTARRVRTATIACGRHPRQALADINYQTTCVCIPLATLRLYSIMVSVYLSECPCVVFATVSSASRPRCVVCTVHTSTSRARSAPQTSSLEAQTRTERQWPILLTLTPPTHMRTQIGGAPSVSMGGGRCGFVDA